jgi:hypothetical protein
MISEAVTIPATAISAIWARNKEEDPFLDDCMLVVGPEPEDIVGISVEDLDVGVSELVSS